MIYLKRFGFVILMIVCTAIGLLLYFISTVTSPIWATIYYVYTGNDPFKEGLFEFLWRLSFDLLDWYKNKFLYEE